MLFTLYLSITTNNYNNYNYILDDIGASFVVVGAITYGFRGLVGKEVVIINIQLLLFLRILYKLFFFSLMLM